MARTTQVLDGGWGWTIVTACFVNNLLVIGLIKTYGILFVQFLKQFKASASVTSLILGVKAAAFSVSAMVVFNILIPRMSIRKLSLLGASLTSGGALLSIFANSVAFTVFSQSVLTGLGNAFVYGPGIFLIGQYFEKKRPLAMAIANSGVSIGLMILPPIITFLFEEYGFQGGLLLLGGMMMQTIVCAATYRPFTPIIKYPSKIVKENEHDDDVDKMQEVLKVAEAKEAERGETIQKENAEIKKARQLSVKKFFKTTDLSIFTEPIFIVILGFSFFGLIGNELSGTFIPALAREKGLTEMQTANLLTIAAALDLFSRLIPGVVSQFDLMSRSNLMVVAIVVMGIAFQFTAFINSFQLMVVFVVVFGCFSGFFFSLLPVMVIDFVGFQKFPKAFGFIQIFQGIAGAAAYPVLGMFKDVTGDYSVTFHFLGASLLLASGVIMTEPLLRKLGKNKKIPAA